MADEKDLKRTRNVGKKEDSFKKERRGVGGGPEPELIIVLGLFLVIFGGGLLAYLSNLLGNISLFGQSPFLQDTLPRIRTILQWVAFLSIIGISYVLIQFERLRRKRILEMKAVVLKEGPAGDIRWQRIVTLAESDNPSDRKVAIVEADNLLDELVTKMGYSGESLGEKLKSIEVGNFTTLDDAWEAHKSRNRIAHQNEEVTRRETRRVISLYDRVFREFEYI